MPAPSVFFQGVTLYGHPNADLPVGERHGLDEQRARVAVADRLEKVDIPQNYVIFHGVLWVGFVTLFKQVVIKYIKRTLSSRAHMCTNNIFMKNLM